MVSLVNGEVVWKVLYNKSDEEDMNQDNLIEFSLEKQWTKPHQEFQKGPGKGLDWFGSAAAAHLSRKCRSVGNGLPPIVTTKNNG